MQKTNIITIFFSEILYRHCKLAILGNLEMIDHILKIIVSICSNFSCLPGCKKSTSPFTSLLRYWRERNSKLSDSGNSGHAHQKWQYHSEETFDNYQQGKIIQTSFLYVFLKILLGYYKVVALGALGMPDHAHPKWCYQFVEKCCVYLQVKNQFHSSCFSGDTAKICRLIFGTLGMSGYT